MVATPSASELDENGKLGERHARCYRLHGCPPLLHGCRRTSSPPRRSPPSRLLPIVFTHAGSTQKEGGAGSANALPATMTDPRRRSWIRAHGAQSNGWIRRRIASHRQSPIDAAHASIAPVHAPRRHWIRRSSSSSLLLIPEPPPPLLLDAGPPHPRTAAAPPHCQAITGTASPPLLIP